MGFYTEAESNGDFLPYIAFNAKSDKWSARVGEEKVPLKGEVKFVADFPNIKTGWFLFMEGSAPNIVLDETLSEVAPKPSNIHKRGAKLNVLLAGEYKGVYEFSSNSKLVMTSLSNLHDEYLEGKKKNGDKLPVITVGESIEAKASFKNDDGTQGTATNYAPVFSITGWIERPSDFDESAKEQEVEPKAAASASEF